jgi:hypothetical protein
LAFFIGGRELRCKAILVKKVSNRKEVRIELKHVMSMNLKSIEKEEV